MFIVLLASIAGPGYFYFDHITESFHVWESFKHPLFLTKLWAPEFGDASPPADALRIFASRRIEKAKISPPS